MSPIRERERATHLIALGSLMLVHELRRAEIERDIESDELFTEYHSYLNQQLTCSRDRAREIFDTLTAEHRGVTQPRKPEAVIEQLLEIVSAKPDYRDLGIRLKRIRNGTSFRAPELVHLTWGEIAEALDEVLPSERNENSLDATMKKLVRVFTNNPSIV
jgi:hypothetical protein